MAVKELRRSVQKLKQDIAAFKRSARGLVESTRVPYSAWSSAAGYHARAIVVQRSVRNMKSYANSPLDANIVVVQTALDKMARDMSKCFPADR
jgi:hypothetical protein